MNIYVPLQNQIIISTEYVTKLRPISPICCQNGALSLFSSIFYGEKLERIVFSLFLRTESRMQQPVKHIGINYL
jgi:hypothetical protein